MVEKLEGVGHGIVQWSFERANALSSFAESHPEFGQVVVKHWKISKTTSWEQETCHIPNMAGQVAFMASELADGYKNVRDKMKGASTASEAAEIFMKDYEKPATSTATERQQAAENAVKMIEACTGVVLRSYSFFILRKNVFLPIYICIYLGTCLFSI